MWQWSADASRGVAYHIHLVQQVITLILSMVLPTWSGACIQAKMNCRMIVCLIIASQPKSISINTSFIVQARLAAHTKIILNCGAQKDPTHPSPTLELIPML